MEKRRWLTRLGGMKQIKPEEMKVISAIVSGDKAAKDTAFAEGLFIGGERYVMARAEDRSIYARSVSVSRSRHTSDGAFVTPSCR